MYDIEVRNPHGLCRGVRRLVVDGQPVDGQIAPLPRHRGQNTRVAAVLEKR